MDSSTIYTAVKERYTATALTPSNPSHTSTVAQAFGYSAPDLASIPAEANLGVSCGNPLALAHLKRGETVVDLGCGAGFDCFLAARKVGPEGRVIGIDMNEDMLARARANASLSNTEFVASRITDVALPSGIADVVISNCVINLVPHAEKNLVFRDMFRLLKPGGRVAVSDILVKEDLPEEVKGDLALYVGCIAGASRRDEYEGWLREAGFVGVVVVDAGVDLNVYTRTEEEGEEAASRPVKEEQNKNDRSTGCCGTDKPDGGIISGMRTNFHDVDLNAWAGSYKIFAVKDV